MKISKYEAIACGAALFLSGVVGGYELRKKAEDFLNPPISESSYSVERKDYSVGNAVQDIEDEPSPLVQEINEATELLNKNHESLKRTMNKFALTLEAEGIITPGAVELLEYSSENNS